MIEIREMGKKWLYLRLFEDKSGGQKSADNSTSWFAGFARSKINIHFNTLEHTKLNTPVIKQPIRSYRSSASCLVSLYRLIKTSFLYIVRFVFTVEPNAKFQCKFTKVEKRSVKNVSTMKPNMHVL